jgi:hypothetical protein
MAGHRGGEAVRQLDLDALRRPDSHCPSISPDPGLAYARAMPSAPRLPLFHLYGDPPDDQAFDCSISSTSKTIASRSSVHDGTIHAHRHRNLFQILLLERGRGDMAYGTMAFPRRRDPDPAHRRPWLQVRAAGNLWRGGEPRTGPVARRALRRGAGPADDTDAPADAPAVHPVRRPEFRALPGARGYWLADRHRHGATGGRSRQHQRPGQSGTAAEPGYLAGQGVRLLGQSCATAMWSAILLMTQPT